MSEYRWYVRQMWIGVRVAVPKPWITSDYHASELVGVIIRSGHVRAVGHFCHTYVSYLGKKRYAAGAEDRIYPFHSLTLEPGEEPKKLELVFIGWCSDKDTPAFITGSFTPLSLVGAAKDPDNVEVIPSKLWLPQWTPEYLRKMWETQGVLRAVEERQKELCRRGLNEVRREAEERRTRELEQE